jgi:hypothetical protein
MDPAVSQELSAPKKPGVWSLNDAIKPKSEPRMSQHIAETTKATTGPCAD